MPDISTGEIKQIVLAVIAAASLAFGGAQTSQVGSCRELMQDQRESCVGTLETLAHSYALTVEIARDVCRERE